MFSLSLLWREYGNWIELLDICYVSRYSCRNGKDHCEQEDRKSRFSRI